MDFWREKSIVQYKIFPAKRLCIFFTQNQTLFKSADLFFFPKVNFPAKRLSYISDFFRSLLKAQYFFNQENSLAKRLSFLSIFFEELNFQAKTIFPLFQLFVKSTGNAPNNFLLKVLLLQSAWLGLAKLSLALFFSPLNFLHVSVWSSTLEGKIRNELSCKHYSFSAIVQEMNVAKNVLQ